MTTPPSCTHQQDAAEWPLLDSAALAELLQALNGDTTAVTAFVDAVIVRWPERLERLKACLDTRNIAAARDCALSLKSSSHMVGAKRLCGLANRMDAVVRAGDFEEARSCLVELTQTGIESISLLASLPHTA